MLALTIAERERWEIGTGAATEHDELSVAAETTDSVERAAFFMAANLYYAQLAHDPMAWEEELAERRIWEDTLADGLEPE
jgi:hypothetical protein